MSQVIQARRASECVHSFHASECVYLNRQCTHSLARRACIGAICIEIKSLTALPFGAKESSRRSRASQKEQIR